MGLKESGLRGSLRSTSSVLPAFFDVTITNTNSPVQEGDILTVDYSADNTGDAQDMQDIRLEIDSVQEDVDLDVMLAGGASTTGTLEWDTTDEDEAEYTATVLSDDDSDSVIVEIGDDIPDSAIEFFEDGDLSAYGGDIEDFDVNQEDPVVEGDFSLKFTGEENAGIGSDEIPNIPVRGEAFELFGQVRDGTNHAVEVSILHDQGKGKVNNGNGYLISATARDDDLVIQRIDNGSGAETETASISGGMPTGETVRLEVRLHDNDDIEAILEDSDGTEIGSVILNDDNHNGDGFGFNNNFSVDVSNEWGAMIDAVNNLGEI